MGIVVAGAGYVGLATALGMAQKGHEVELVDTDSDRVEALHQGDLPFHEPSLAIALKDALSRGLRVHGAYPDRFKNPAFAFVCVNTDGTSNVLDTRSVESAVSSLARICPPETALVVRSTVNPGTTAALNRWLRQCGLQHAVLSNPEFLREGSALSDFAAPTRVVIGGEDPVLRARLAALYEFTGAPVLQTDPTSAELIKLAANAALAVRISLANELADLAIAEGADVEAVLDAVGADPRIGRDYLTPGIGFGGYCLPKDLDALRSRPAPTAVLDATAIVNDRTVERLLRTVCSALSPGSRVAVIGAGFKPGSDSTRGSRSLVLIERLLAEGFCVTVCDPLAERNVRHAVGDAVSYGSSPRDVATGCDGVVLAHPLPPDEVRTLVRLTPHVWDDLGRRWHGEATGK